MAYSGAIVPADADDPSETDISFIYRDWYQEVSVRSNLVDHGQLFTSHKGPQESLKVCIKDAVRNMYVLRPLLERIALSSQHRLFSVKDAKNEFPSLICLECFLVYWVS